MKNVKLENNLVGENNWPVLPSIFIKGIAGQLDVSPDNTEEENEKIIQSWKNIAVFKVTSDRPVKFYAGFSNYAAVCYLKHEFLTDITYGMRISSTDNRYFAMPKDLSDKINIELIEITTEDDIRYNDLILI